MCGTKGSRAFQPGPLSCGGRDCVILLTDHKSFEPREIVKHAKLIVDTRNAMKNVKSRKIVKL